MEHLIWLPAIFGFLAYLEIGSLKGRIKRLEDQLGNVKDSPIHTEKTALMKLLTEYIGKEVNLEFRGEQYDPDLYTSRNKCTVLSIDDEWVLVQISGKNCNKEKLFRLHQINGVKGIK